MDWVEHEDDEVMEILCFTDKDLDKVINILIYYEKKNIFFNII